MFFEVAERRAASAAYRLFSGNTGLRNPIMKTHDQSHSERGGASATTGLGSTTSGASGLTRYRASLCVCGCSTHSQRRRARSWRPDVNVNSRTNANQKSMPHQIRRRFPEQSVVIPASPPDKFKARCSISVNLTFTDYLLVSCCTV